MSIDNKTITKVMIIDHTDRTYKIAAYVREIPIESYINLEAWYKEFWEKHQVMEWYE